MYTLEARRVTCAARAPPGDSGYPHARARSGGQCSGSASEPATGRSAPVGPGGAVRRKVQAASSRNASRRAGLREAAAEGAGPGCPAPSGRHSSPARGGRRRQRGPVQRSAAPGALPAVSFTRSPARRPRERRGPASNARAGTDQQHSAAAAPRPFVTPRTNRSPALASPSNQRGCGRGRGLSARRRRLLGSPSFLCVRCWVSVRGGPDVGLFLAAVGTCLRPSWLGWRPAARSAGSGGSKPLAGRRCGLHLTRGHPRLLLEAPQGLV